MTIQYDPDDLPHGFRTQQWDPHRYRPWEREWRGARPERDADQRMSQMDLVRMGGVMAVETGKTVLELIEEVARGDRTMTSQQLAACVAALPYRHAKLTETKLDMRFTSDPRELTDEQLAAIIGRAEREVERRERPPMPASVVATPRGSGRLN